MDNFAKRFTDGELVSADSTHLPDSLKYFTKVNRRTVYGGGGIMPDVFVGADTSNYSDYYRDLIRKNVFNTFILEYIDKNRNRLKEGYPSFELFMSKFQFSKEEINAFISEGEKAGVKLKQKDYDISKGEIFKVLKALVANYIWQTTEYFRIANEGDVVIEKALKVLSDEKTYRKILGYKQ
jgi:carboxyl-terminal processing protease